MEEFNKEIAIIHWEDSWSHGNLQLGEEEWRSKGIGYGVSVGLIVNEDEKQISLAADYFYPQEVDTEGSFRMVNSFPKSGIHEIVRIKIPNQIKDQVAKYFKKEKEESRKQVI